MTRTRSKKASRVNVRPDVELPPAWLKRHLTPSEQAVVKLVVTGLPDKEIAAQLGNSSITARNQFRRAMNKLGFKNRYALIAAARPIPAPRLPEPVDDYAHGI